jgi:hypothetical protein
MKNKLPKDPNQLAAEIVHQSVQDEVSKYLSSIGRKGGLKGGKERAKRLTPEERSEIARKAAKVRWKKEKRGEQ